MKILGISCYYHDGAAALIEDGVVRAAAEEERFSRIKHDSNFPVHSIDFCLKQTGITSQDLDWVIFYEKPFLKFERINLTFMSTVPYARQEFINAYKIWIKKKLWIKTSIVNHLKISSEKVLFSFHHLSHAASSYYTSPFRSSAILTCDGVGEWTTLSWGKAKESKIYLNSEIKFPHSLGLFYSTFTQFLGFEINEGEYKVMGLAPYGKPRYVEKIEKLINQYHDSSFTLNLDYFNFHISEKNSFSRKLIDLLGIKPLDPRKSDQVIGKYADIAASVQKVLEEKLIKIAKKIKLETNEENLCYAGGVALNGVANWRIFKEAGFKNIFIHPAAGDSGGAVGSALYLYYHILNNPKKEVSFNVYLGQKNEEVDIEYFIKNNSIKTQKLDDEELEDIVVNLLSLGKVIGWVKGRFEWGPRALGARSILADPRKKQMKDKVNKKIKFREAFRPFAPVALYEKGRDYFDIGDKIPPILEYMLGVIPVNKKWQDKLGAVTHIDCTARPQLIKKEVNKTYYNIVKKFGQKNGVYCLLNTSFNLRGEPMVNTIEDAFKTFKSSGLDALVIENYLIEK